MRNNKTVSPSEQLVTQLTKKALKGNSATGMGCFAAIASHLDIDEVLTPEDVEARCRNTAHSLFALASAEPSLAVRKLYGAAAALVMVLQAARTEVASSSTRLFKQMAERDGFAWDDIEKAAKGELQAVEPPPAAPASEAMVRMLQHHTDSQEDSVVAEEPAGSPEEHAAEFHVDPTDDDVRLANDEHLEDASDPGELKAEELSLHGFDELDAEEGRREMSLSEVFESSPDSSSAVGRWSNYAIDQVGSPGAGAADLTSSISPETFASLN